MIRKKFEKYKDIIAYAFFGVCTTIVNIVSYWAFAHLFGMSVMPSTVAAWILAVFFAFVTNRKWVFHSKVINIDAIVKELFSFFACRLVTGIFDWGCMFLLVDVMEWNDMAVKIVSNVFVIILNYIASKFIIFKNSK